MRHTLSLLAILLVCTVAAGAAADEQLAACTINIKGNGPDDESVQSASIMCSGSALSMAISAAKLGKFKQQFEGVVLDPDSCGEDVDCLVTFCGSSNVILKNSTISNVADASMTAMLCIIGKSSVNLQDSRFSGNTAENGTIHVRDQAAVTVTNSIITDATGIRGGGAQISGKSTLKSVSSLWANNTAEYGAAVNVRGESTLWILNGSVFDGNYAYTEYDYGPAGAAAYCRDSGNIYVQNSNIFNNNIAEGYDSAGAVIYLQDDCTVEIKNGNKFTNNAAILDNAAGGAVLGADRSIVTVTGNNTFYNNSAMGDNSGGGAILVRDAAALRISSGVNFTKNYAEGDVAQGGAVYASNNATLLIENDVIFDGNTAAGVNSQGGAINIRQATVTVIRKGVKFVGNTASYGGGIAAIGNMPFNISDAVFTHHEVLGNGGALYLEGSFNANVNSCLISSNRAAQGGGIMATSSTSSQDSNFTLSLTGNTAILNNSATTGGGISLVSGATTFGPGVVVSQNYAAQGGGISISQGPAASANVTFSPKTVITNNTAVVAGGGIYLDAASVRINEATARAIATGNTAAFGPDLSLLSECLPGEVRAGAWCQRCGANLFSFNPANTSCDICPDDATCTGGTVIIPRSGHWHSSAWSTQIHRCPNPAACSQQGREELFSPAAGSSSSSSGSRSVATTAAAEALAAATAAKHDGAGNSRALRGLPDADLAYVTAAGSSSRLVARSLLRRSRGGPLSNSQGDDLTRSTAVVRRPSLHLWFGGSSGGRTLMVVGSDSAAVADRAAVVAITPALPRLPSDGVDWQCAAGYRGHLCGSCESDHGLRGPFRCARCMTLSASVVLYIVAFLVLMVVIWIMAHVTWVDNQDATPELRTSDVLKVLIVYFQCMMIMTGLQVDWPVSIDGVFSGLTWLFSAGNSQLLSVDCLVAHMQVALPVAVVRQLVYLVAPVAMFIAVVLLQWCACGSHWWWRRYRRRRLGRSVLSEVRDRIPVIAIVTLMFFYPSLIRVALSMFACYPIDSTGGLYPQYAIANSTSGYWQYDMDQACWSGWHKGWALGLGLPFTLLFCVGIPVGVALLMWVNRGRLDDLRFRRNCGFLYRLYCQRCSFWEAVVAVQFVLLVLVSVFGPNIGVWHEALLLNFLFGVFMVLLLLFRPFKFDRLHTIALLSMGCLSFTAYAALSFLPTMTADVATVYKEVAGALVIIANAGFLLWVGYCILTLMKQLLGKMKSLRAASKQSSKGPKESKFNYPIELPSGAAAAASTAGAKAGAAAAKAVALAATRVGKTAASGTVRGPIAPSSLGKAV